MHKTLVMGIGNTLLSDEGVGVHALAYLRRVVSERPDVEFLDGGTLSFTLAGVIEDADNLIVLDAAQLGEVPGTVRRFVGAEMDHFLGSAKRSVHEVGLCDLMDMVRLTGRLPRNRALIAIQPQQLGWGDAPTPAVAGAIPQAAWHVLDLVGAWAR